MSTCGDVLRAGEHRWVPHNRWDMVTDEVAASAGAARVAVVVPYFEQPASLQRMYVALEGQRIERLEVIVVDDGSRTSPPPPPSGFPIPVRMLEQPDLGCRPGAARNLAVAATDADILVFLDADTLPAPDTVSRLAAWPNVLADALVVGRRRHADLTDWSPAEAGAWLDGTIDRSPGLREDPPWLDAGYAQSRDLLDVDDRSYRFVISAVMACHRSLYDDVGGFDGTRTEYGGDDWDFAFRAFNNGAVLVHEPHAVGWHDEPDWSERDGRVDAKNGQTLWLASVITEPLARSRSLRYRIPDVVVRLCAEGAISVDALVTTVASVFDAVPDAVVHVEGPVADEVLEAVSQDGRVRRGAVSDEILLRCRTVLDLSQPVRWDRRGLRSVLEAVRPGGVGQVHVEHERQRVATVTATRAAGRTRRAGRFGVAPTDAMARLFGVEVIEAGAAGCQPWTTTIDLAAMFGRW